METHLREVLDLLKAAHPDHAKRSGSFHGGSGHGGYHSNGHGNGHGGSSNHSGSNGHGGASTRPKHRPGERERAASVPPGRSESRGSRSKSFFREVGGREGGAREGGAREGGGREGGGHQSGGTRSSGSRRVESRQDDEFFTIDAREGQLDARGGSRDSPPLQPSRPDSRSGQIRASDKRGLTPARPTAVRPGGAATASRDGSRATSPVQQFQLRA